MDISGILRGIKIPEPKCMNYEIGEKLQTLKHYSKLNSHIPPMKKLFDLKNSGSNIIFENDTVITGLNISNDDSIKGNCSLDVLVNGKPRTIEAYLKVTHLIDPVRYLQQDETLDIEAKVNNPWNQAYVETVASYALGKLRKEDISPNFNYFYGAFTSIAKTYNFNISDEVESYKMYRWFWDNIENEKMNIIVESDDTELSKEVYDEIMIKPDYCLDKKENNDVEELDNIPTNECYEIESLDSASIKTQSTITTKGSSELSDDEEDGDEYNVYIKLKDFPTMMIFTEKNESTMDDLLEDFEAVGSKPNTKLWEEKWSAWLFQVIAGLCVAQTLFGFTHNDLHTNNIVWSNTDEKYFYYKTNDNKIFRVPTYGKVFKIIDFGRSIFSINEHLFVSDDFCEGNDAATQYNFPELTDGYREDEPIVYPSASFDLARLSISLLEGLFPEIPDDKEDGKILSDEPHKTVNETTSDLFNILWTWLIDVEGNNILINDENEERFPDFDLYVHIATSCKNCVPKEQIYKKPFSKFMIDTKIQKDVKLYPLFV
jgi:hypothetical protein